MVAGHFLSEKKPNEQIGSAQGYISLGHICHTKKPCKIEGECGQLQVKDKCLTRP